MIVTLDAFSGRPNPSWRLSDRDNASLLERVVGRALAAETETAGDAVLGLRGFIISAGRDDEVPEGLPSTFRVGGPMPSSLAAAQSGAAPLSAAESLEISRFLLNTGSHVLDSDLMMFLETSIQKIAQPAPTGRTRGDCGGTAT